MDKLEPAGQGRYYGSISLIPVHPQDGVLQGIQWKSTIFIDPCVWWRPLIFHLQPHKPGQNEPYPGYFSFVCCKTYMLIFPLFIDGSSRVLLNYFIYTFSHFMHSSFTI